MRRRIVCILWLALQAFVAGNTGAEGAGLQLEVIANQSEYVLGEPVKLKVRIWNRSESPLPVLDPGRMGTNMEFMHYEIEHPNGALHRRKYQYLSFTEIVNPKWHGFTIGPGQYMVTYLYPSYTHQHLEWSEEWAKNEEDRAGPTFPAVGTYRLTVVYEVPRSYEYIRSVSGERLESNVVDLTFREPTREEREILRACWTEPLVWAGDHVIFDSQLVAELEALIATERRDPVMFYAGLLLAHQLGQTPYESASPAWRDAISRGRDIATSLIGESPAMFDFDVRVVVSQSATSSVNGDPVPGRRVLLEALKADPDLIRNYRYLSWTLWSRYREGIEVPNARKALGRAVTGPLDASPEELLELWWGEE